MDGHLRPDCTTRGSILPASPTNSFLTDEVASICPLITPSPPTNALVDPPQDEAAQENYAIGDELAEKLQHVQGDDGINIGRGESPNSRSSSSSAIAEPPACTQLLNHRNVYHPYTDEDEQPQETAGKVQPLQLTFRNPPDNYFFMSWNWPLIRKISHWTFLAGMAAMVATCVAMIYTLPRTCNPQTQWYQGSVFYEIFPASYHDASKNMVGDFEGITRNMEYIKRLGVRGVRLNSIFETENYPENYKNVSTLIKIAHQLGTFQDLENLVSKFKQENISVILDLPVWPVVKQLVSKEVADNETNSDLVVEFLTINPTDVVEEAITYWTEIGIEGFYLKGLEHFTEDPNFVQSLRSWRKALGTDRIFIISEEVIDKSPSETIVNIVLNNVDLVDIRLHIERGVDEIEKQVKKIHNGTLFSRPGMPWIQWSLGDENTTRLVNRLQNANGTLGAILFQMMLPGTPSIFYGDEIGLHQVYDPQDERADIKHLHHLSSMVWADRQQDILSWMHGERVDVNFEQVDVIANMTRLRSESPSIYVNSVYRDGQSRPNAEIVYAQDDLLVLQRWYPRRRAFVVVSNFGKNQIETDLSTLLYSGSVKVGPGPNSKAEKVVFKKISLWPAQSVVVELD